MTNSDRPIALEAYEKLAQGYSDIAENKAENGYNEHPAMRKAIGSVEGLCVLDAGCGPGFLTRDLLKGGAKHVSAFDISPKMIAIAKERCGDKASFFIHDMAKPHSQLTDESFDLVTSSLAIDYVRDWKTPLSEFHRVLKPTGKIILSVQHPMGAFKWFQPPTAFGVHLCEAEWKGFTKEAVTVPDYYRSVEEIFNPILRAGFALSQITETKPVKELEKINPRKYLNGITHPTFMIIEAQKT